MPNDNRSDRDRLPSTLERSPEKAQRTYLETLESAERTYDGDEERAHRAAFAAVKHSFEKVGDHWEPKEHRGPSDAQAARGGNTARDGGGETAQGVDANASKSHLLDVARRLEIPGRSKMSKDELVEAIERANRRETARARS
ncbi:MAG: ChaB family protein [Actinobacteria bacterium]|nr:ChaB family protein [Actinomycetota bacterium]